VILKGVGVMPESADVVLAQSLPDLSGFLADADRLLVGGDGHWGTLSEIVPNDAAKPLGVVLRLRMQAGHLYHAVLRLIEDPIAAPAAEILCRAMLENFAHMYWISQGEPHAMDRPLRARADRCLGLVSDSDSSTISRAACLELGMAKAYARNLDKASNTAQRNEQIEQPPLVG
jgi:hypothetical protein